MLKITGSTGSIANSKETKDKIGGDSIVDSGKAIN